MPDFQKITRTVMSDYGLNQTQLGKKVGCGQPTISKILTGRTKTPDFDIARKLVKLYEKRPK